MKEEYDELIREAYAAFNARDIDKVLRLMDAGVHWPNGWEGGYVEGHDAVRDYWTRQWAVLNPRVEPVAIAEGREGSVEVKVHQLVKDLQGNVVFDGTVYHVYRFAGGRIKTMEIVEG